MAQNTLVTRGQQVQIATTELESVNKPADQD